MIAYIIRRLLYAIPILIGGHADAALRRAARNDGWMHGGGTEDLDELLEKLNRYREEEGTAVI